MYFSDPKNYFDRQNLETLRTSLVLRIGTRIIVLIKARTSPMSITLILRPSVNVQWIYVIEIYRSFYVLV